MRKRLPHASEVDFPPRRSRWQPSNPAERMLRPSLSRGKGWSRSVWILRVLGEERKVKKKE